MRSIISLGFLSSIVLSCAEASSSETASMQSSDRYAVGSTFGFADILDKRMSLISPANARTMYTLYGTDEPLILGLSAHQHTVTMEGSNYRYLDPSKVLRFKYGPMINNSSRYYAELLDYETGKAVGYVYYGVSASDYPYSPNNLAQLCTGKYEEVCILNFNKETNLFSITFKE